ncbi:hypothetical protein ACQ4PT_061129 [Festuca glaucescens]
MVAAEGAGAVQVGPATAADGGLGGEQDGDSCTAAKGTAAKGRAAAEGTAAEGRAAAGVSTPVLLPLASSAADMVDSAAGFGRGATNGSASRAASSTWPDGVDRKSSYLLKIRLLGNPKKTRNDICYFFEKVIDSDLTNYKDLVQSIVEEYPPCYLEVAHLQYYDDVLKTFPEIKSDQELMFMFEKHSETKFVHMFVAYCDPSEPYEPITEHCTDMHVQPNNSAEHDDDSYLRNPIPENEHVGIDEENIYLEKEPIPLNMVLFSGKEKEKDKGYVPEDESEDESEGENEAEVEDEEEVHEADHAQNVEYDKEDPPMTVGSTYPNMDEFKLALRQHAVKREFEYNTEKSAPRRFRCYCKRRDEDDCPWRIHASTTDDMQTVVVRKNPYDHDCSSTTRKKKVKNATKHWICEKVKDWLIEDATLGAKELRKKLKEHYKIKIHYKRLYMGLAICTDAGQAVMTGVKEVFPDAEHRECMFHLVSNFKKKFHGKVFDDHLWVAAYSWNPYLFDKHWVAMEATKPAATAYLRKWHNRLWSRSQFSTLCKVDYVTNNLAECFNNWIKHHKSLNLDDFMDKVRQLIMIKWNERRKVGKKLDGLILPHITKKLNAMTRELNLEVVECSEEVAEVTALGGSGFRFVVNLQERTCSCRQWQVCGLPCKHALAFITSLSNGHIKNYIDLYYSTDKFRAAYVQLIPAMPDKTQWPKSDHGFFMHPPLLKPTAGRPKTERYKGCGETKNKKGKHLCPICKDYGHHWHNCKKGNPEDIAAMLTVR